jgi:DNA-binding transcriptional MocR family regulator
MACLQGLDAYNRTIYIGTFTKSLFPGLRIAYMIVPSELTEPFTMARTLMDGHTASITQLTLAKFLEEGILAPTFARCGAFMLLVATTGKHDGRISLIMLL